MKQPDSAFSLGVVKVESEPALKSTLEKLFARSELVIAQEWLPTEFDWRVGILERRPLYVCKYYMAPGHWQVIKRESAQRIEGTTTTMAVMTTITEASRNLRQGSWFSRESQLLPAGECAAARPAILRQTLPDLTSV